MKQFAAILFTSLALVAGLAQVVRVNDLGGPVSVIDPTIAFGLPRNGLKALYTFGPDPTLVPGARWFQPGRNLLLWSEAFDNWQQQYVTVTPDVATAPDGTETADKLVEDTSTGNHSVFQAFTYSSGINYRLSIYLKAAERSRIRLTRIATLAGVLCDLSSEEATLVDGGGDFSDPAIEAVGNGWYRCSGTIVTSSSDVYLRLDNGSTADYTGDGSSGIYIWGAQLEPGTSPTAYQKTEAQQTFHDWSGNGSTASRGSDDEAEDTNDPQLTPSSRNLLAPGSTEALDDTAHWDAYNDMVVTANQAVAPDGTTTAEKLASTNGSAHVSQLVSIHQGVQYTGSIYLRADEAITAHISLRRANFTNIQDEAVSLNTAWQRFEVSGTNNDADTIRLVVGAPYGGWPTNKNVYAWGAQLETGSTATAYTNPAEESLVFGADFSTDDFVTVSSLSLSSDWTFIAVIKPDDNTSVGLWRNGTAAPNVSLDANGKVSYTNGTDTVASTNAIPIGVWSVIAVVNDGGTIRHYLNGVANGSGDASGASNAFSALRIGYDGTAYFEGTIAGFSAYKTALPIGSLKRVYSGFKRYWNYNQRNEREMAIP